MGSADDEEAVVGPTLKVHGVRPIDAASLLILMQQACAIPPALILGLHFETAYLSSCQYNLEL